MIKIHKSFFVGVDLGLEFDTKILYSVRKKMKSTLKKTLKKIVLKSHRTSPGIDFCGRHKQGPCTYEKRVQHHRCWACR